MDELFETVLNAYSNDEIPPIQQPPLLLAYLGDAIYEMIVRTMVCSGKDTKVNELHNKTIRYVKAKAQSEMMNTLLPLLNEEELSIYKRGRNTKSAVPKSAEVSEYRRATGFEALLGYLYLQKRYDRIVELVKHGISDLYKQ